MEKVVIKCIICLKQFYKKWARKYCSFICRKEGQKINDKRYRETLKLENVKNKKLL